MLMQKAVLIKLRQVGRPVTGMMTDVTDIWLARSLR